METQSGRHTPLYNVHRELGAKIISFAGWELPVYYRGVNQEHTTVRQYAGLFDVSHMGEIFITGPKALAAAMRLLSNNVAKMTDGQAAYCGILQENGGFIDDVIIYRFHSEKFLLVVNGANVNRVAAWTQENSFGATVENRSEEYSQLAIQGPRTAAIVQKVSPLDLSKLGRYRHTDSEIAGISCLISRTGYTGEDGFELYCCPSQAPKLWEALWEAGSDHGLLPIGLGARDSLRLEMKYALYGNDIDDQHTPLEAGLAWIVSMDKGEFIGRSALEKQLREGVTRKLVGFELLEKGIPRQGYRLFHNGQAVGIVTSGTLSPSLGIPIGIGYVPASLSKEGSTFQVEIRGRLVLAKVVSTPFYKINKSGN